MILTRCSIGRKLSNFFNFFSFCSLLILLGFVSAVAFFYLVSLEDDDAGLDVVPLDSESELRSDGIDSTSSAARSRSSYLTASFLRCRYFNPSLAVFIIVIISVVSNP